MKYFLSNFALFLLFPLVTYVPFNIWILPNLMERNIGPSVETQISTQFTNAMDREYEMLILGNSRLYQGVNPDEFSVNTFNFAHDNDSYNQAFHKLNYLYENGVSIKNLVLGIDYFQFGVFSDSRNYVYSSKLGENYLKDYNFKYPKFVYYKDLLKPNRLVRLRNKNKLAYIKSNGQYIKDGKAKKDNTVKRSVTFFEIQLQYFKEIIKFCKERKIKIFLVMPPVRENELRSYSETDLREFDAFLSTFSKNEFIYLNFSQDNTFDYNDFTDITHLNESGADRFSKKLNDSIVKYNNQNVN